MLADMPVALIFGSWRFIVSGILTGPYAEGLAGAPSRLAREPKEEQMDGLQPLFLTGDPVMSFPGKPGLTGTDRPTIP